MIQAIVSPTTKQNLTLQAAERLIRRRATPSDADDLVDVLRAEIASGVPIADTLAEVQAWISEEADPTPETHTTTRHESGFCIIPASLMKSRDFMQSLPNDMRVLLQMLQHSNGGTGEAFPSTRTLMRSTHISDQANTRRAIRKLKNDGWLVDTGRTIGNGVKVRRVVLPPPPVTCDTPPLSRKTAVRDPLKRSPEKNNPQPPPKAPSVIQNGSCCSPIHIDQKATSATPSTTVKIENSSSFQTVPTYSLHPTISDKDRTVISRMVAKLEKDQASEILAELSARLDGIGETVRSPVAFVAALIRSVQNGTWAPSAGRIAQETKEHKRQTEENRKNELAAEQAREKLEQAAQQQLAAAKRSLSPKELQRHREQFIAELQEQSEFTFKRLKAAKFEGFSFNMAFDGYLKRVLVTDI